MEHKQTEVTITAVDEAQGIVEAIWAVMGNVDDVGDIVHPGAFTKTFNERKHAVKLLDNHRTDSVMSALGTVLELREMRKAELPQALVSNPDVTGGAWGKFQFLMDTPEGKGAFTRIQHGAVKEWSFGYDAVDKDYTNKDGKSVRNLRQIKLYEVSPVLFPANSATTTTSAKSAPSEGKPYGVVEEDGQYCVYKLDADGNPTGKPLGKHPTEAEAETQRRALYANEDDDKSAESGGEKASKEMTDRGPVRRLGDCLQGSIHKIFTLMCDDWYTQGLMSRDERIQLSSLIGDALDILSSGMPEELAMRSLQSSDYMYYMSLGLESEIKAGRVINARIAKRIRDAMDNLHQCLMDAGLMEVPEEDDTGPQKSADTSTSSAKEAGTPEDESTRLLKLIELELEELEV